MSPRRVWSKAGPPAKKLADQNCVQLERSGRDFACKFDSCARSARGRLASFLADRRAAVARPARAILAQQLLTQQ